MRSPFSTPPCPVAAAATLGILLAACGDRTSAPIGTGPELASSESRSATAATVGQRVFDDVRLSLRQNQACASCHDAAWGFSSPNPGINAAGAVMFGSVSTRFGNRKPPSAAYATQSPVRFYDAAGGTYVGGNFWDGRATGARLGSPAAEQALGPFVNSVEMALPDKACVIYRIAKGPYADQYRAVYGAAISTIRFPDGTDALCAREGTTVPLPQEDRERLLHEYDNVGLAVAAFEASPVVNRFSSRYDASLRGRGRLTPREQRGLALFIGKGNCAACHPSDGEHPLFTDYTYDNIGVPRNPQNPASIANVSFRDLGVGGVTNEPAEYGREKVPTLRNLDKRGVPGGVKSYMHNGFFKSIEQVVHFYNTRDVLPDCETRTSPVVGVNCWPAPEVRENVNRDELGKLGLTPDEEADLVAFLRTLNDDQPREAGR